MENNKANKYSKLKLEKKRELIIFKRNNTDCSQRFLASRYNTLWETTEGKKIPEIKNQIPNPLYSHFSFILSFLFYTLISTTVTTVNSLSSSIEFSNQSNQPKPS